MMMSETETTARTRADRWIAVLLALAALLIAASWLNFDCYWGDDYAAYMNDGIAIAEGKYDEQIRLNYRMHYTTLPRDTENGELVYAWGYPLVLSLVYRCVGFNRVTFHSLPYYKLVTVFSLAVSTGALYFFFRRRLSRPTAIVLCALLAFNLIVEIDLLYSDLFFFALMMLCLLAAEAFLDRLEATAAGLRGMLPGLALGILMLAVYETRLNGISVCALVAGMQLSHRVFCRRRARDKAGDRKRTIRAMLPWITFGVLLVFCRSFVLRPASSNTADLTLFSWPTALSNTRHYLNLMLELFVDEDLFSGTVRWTVAAALVFFLLFGMVKRVRSDYAIVPFAVFCMVYFITLVALPYAQGLRYCYPILPEVSLFIGLGVDQTGAAAAKKMRQKTKNALRALCMVMACTFFCCLAADRYRPDLRRMLEGEEVRMYAGAYSTRAVETYRYIIENTPEDSVIVFTKPRALFLNTQRVSISSEALEREKQGGDYWLIFEYMDAEEEKEKMEAQDKSWEAVFTNDLFTLYKASEKAAAGGGK